MNHGLYCPLITIHFRMATIIAYRILLHIIDYYSVQKKHLIRDASLLWFIGELYMINLNRRNQMVYRSSLR